MTRRACTGKSLGIYPVECMNTPNTRALIKAAHRRHVAANAETIWRQAAELQKAEKYERRREIREDRHLPDAAEESIVKLENHTEVTNVEPDSLKRLCVLPGAKVWRHPGAEDAPVFCDVFESRRTIYERMGFCRRMPILFGGSVIQRGGGLRGTMISERVRE